MLQIDNVEIRSMKYGPYDNGHIIVGLSNGMIIAFNSVNLDKLYQYTIFYSPIQGITFDPTHLLIVTSTNGDIAVISLIENKVKYFYVELEKKKYCTVQMILNKCDT